MHADSTAHAMMMLGPSYLCILARVHPCNVARTLDAQQQRALAGKGAMSCTNGMLFQLDNVNQPSTREYEMSETTSELDQFVAALQRFFAPANEGGDARGTGRAKAGTSKATAGSETATAAPLAVQLQSTMGVLRYEGITRTVRPHLAVFGRKCAQELVNVAVLTTATNEAGQEVERTLYAQAGRLTVAATDVLNPVQLCAGMHSQSMCAAGPSCTAAR